MQNDQITVLTHSVGRLAKLWAADGTIRGYDDTKHYTVCTEAVSGIRDLSALLTRLESDTHSAIIRGAYRGDAVAAAADPEHKPGFVRRLRTLFEDRPLHTVLIEIDNFEPLFGDPVLDPIACIEEFVRGNLPPPFQGVSYHWQLSSGAGHAKNAGRLKAHVWFWLARPVSSDSLKAWATSLRLPVDTSVFNPVQVHYTAAPIAEPGVSIPVPVRSGFQDGLFGDEVDIRIADVAACDTVPDDRALMGLMPSQGWSLAQAREFLFACDPNAPRDTWFRCIAAIHHELHGSAEGLDLCDEWSSQATNYGGRRDVETTYRSFGRNGLTPITGAWLMKQAAATLGQSGESDSSDVLLSRELAGILAGRFRYEHNGRGWLQYQSGAWVRSGKGEVTEEAKQLGAHLLRKGATAGAQDAEKLVKLAGRAMSAAGIGAAEKLAQSDPRIRVSPEEFDTDRTLVNAANCVVDLVAQSARPHSPEMLLSRQCAAAFVPDASCGLWLEFLREISCNDPEWVDFIWRACGYTLSGFVGEEVMFFLLGQGANGKSVMANVLRRIFNSYASTVPASFLSLSSRDGEAATPSLASLPGARLALANEVEAGSRLSAQTVKVVCSTEAISARHMYGQPFTYNPTHKPWVRGNHKPIITDNDDGIWRRIVLIPFERSFAPHERDLHLEEKLMGEADGILAWMVRGYAEYRRRGLRPTGRIAAASAGYRKESDLLGQWLEECTQLGADFDTDQRHAYGEYVSWCASQGVRPVAKKSFTRALEERGFRQAQRGGGARERTYMGFRLCLFGAQDAQDFV